MYVDLECLIKKIAGCKNNPESSFTTKVGDHIPLGIRPVWLSGCGFESRCSHLNFRYGSCFEQGVP